MSIVQSFRLFLQFLFFAGLAMGLAAQKKERAPVEIRYPTPERFERPTKADDKGVLQWAPWPEIKCETCKGTGKTACATCQRYPDEWTNCMECKRTKEAACRTCGGTGKMWDPLEKMLCPGCFGAGFVACSLCPGSNGTLHTKGGSPKGEKCPSCRGDGGFKCAVCNGTRFVEVAALKPSLKEANAATLAKAATLTDQALTALDGFTGDAKDARKTQKELARILGLAQSIYPPCKRGQKAFEDYMGKLAPAEQYQDYGDMFGHGLGIWRSGYSYYLKMQKRMLELAQKRAEANEKLAGGDKGK